MTFPATNARKSSSKLLLALAAAFALSAVACGPVVPDSPTWKEDVYPLLVSRCIRCHDGATTATGAGDPKIKPPTTGVGATYNFNFADLPPMPWNASPDTAGLILLQGAGPLAVKNDGKPYARRMPPPPNEALEDWQIEIITKWAAAPK